MACIYGIEQPCDECRMCWKGQGTKTSDNDKRNMERLTKRSENGTAVYNTPNGDPVKWENNRHKVLQKLAEYEDLEEQGNLLKDPQELKDNILGRMKEFMDEYRSYSESSIDHFGGKADAMETAMRIVKAMFTEEIGE